MDALRQQYFAMKDATNKHEWLNDNKFIRLELLELQEKLVSGGYLQPTEVNTVEWSFSDRMERASKTFYDYVQNYAPHVMSQNYDDFAKAASESAESDSNRAAYMSEDSERLSLSALSNALIGLHDQAMSYRPEAHSRDYLNEFYEEHARQEPIPKFE